MSTAAHTPGPWSVPHFAEPDTNCECSYVLCDHLMGAVASVYCSGEGLDWQLHGDNPKFAEACANARLIAAAPDMLDALHEIEAIVDDRADVDDGTPNEAMRMLVIVRAAIAKAEGRSP